MKRKVFDLCVAIASVLFSVSALAYIGPGSGISLLGGLWGVLVAIVLAVGAVLIWPIRYMFRRLRRKRGGAEGSQSEASAESVDPADSGQTNRPSNPSE